MKIKTTIGILASFLLITSSFGQIDLKIRHTEGIKAVKLGYGFSLTSANNSNTFFGGYTHYVSDKLYVDSDINFEFGKLDTIATFNNIFLRVGPGYTLINIKNTFYWNLTASLFLGMEKSTGRTITTLGEVQEETEHSNFMFGGGIGTSVEIYFTNSISIEPYFNQYFYGGTDVGSAFYSIGTSLKYNF
ncbi:MAG: hypothetical protein MI922_05170 [Bacteroidales bacterium]|nr:hypothetical protein [Bacteroidales bacterium]